MTWFEARHDYCGAQVTPSDVLLCISTGTYELDTIYSRDPAGRAGQVTGWTRVENGDSLS